MPRQLRLRSRITPAGTHEHAAWSGPVRDGFSKESLESVDFPPSLVRSALTEPTAITPHPATDQRGPATVTVSIVSHGHDLLDRKLMAQLCAVNGG